MTKKRFLALIMSLIIVLSSITFFGVSVNADSSKSWNMSDTDFRNLGTISSTTAVDGLKLIATSSKTMSVISSSASLDGTDYNYCLALGGKGNSSYRAVSLDVSGTTTLKITAKSSGSSERTLAVVNGSGDKVGEITCGSTLATGSVSITGTGTLYIYSTLLTTKAPVSKELLQKQSAKLRGITFGQAKASRLSSAITGGEEFEFLTIKAPRNKNTLPNEISPQRSSLRNPFGEMAHQNIFR